MPTVTLYTDLWPDVGEVLSYMMGLTALRFTVSGIVNTWLRDVPCLFQAFSKGLAGAQRRKLHENLWYAIWHTVSLGLGLYHALRQPWLAELVIGWEPETLVAAYPQTAASMGFKHYYLFELGFWLSCCLFLAFETRRKDFTEMCIHHASTVVLVTFSYLLDFGRPGMLIMLLHDVADVFLYSAKTAQYRQRRGLADALFVGFAVSFFVTRLFLLPVGLFYPLALALWRGERSEGMSAMISHGQSTRLGVLTSIFGVLICLHGMWGYIIAKMVARTLRSSKRVADSGDPRSDDETEARPVK